MRRLMAMWMLLLWLLTGCSAHTTGVQVPEKLPAAKPQAEQPEEPNCAEECLIGLEVERTVYDPSVKTFTYFVYNKSDEAVEFGTQYGFQQKTAVGWVTLPWKPHTGFHDLAYHLEAGETAAFTCSTAQLLTAPGTGTYRLVKEVGGQTLYDEFELGESIYTAATPHGFAPLEVLPTMFSATDVEGTEVLFTTGGIEHLEAAEEFLWKTGMGAACQLRTVQDYGEGSPMVIDVIYENDHYLWRMWSDGVVTEKRFSYLITDGASIYLANGADWANQQRYGGNTVLPLLIPEGVTAEMVTAVEKQAVTRLENSVIRYQVWSEVDGTGLWCASLWGAGEYPDSAKTFSVQRHDFTGGGWGSTYSLDDWDRTETAMTAIEWRFGGKLRLSCLAADGGESILEFDPETETLRYLLGEIPTEES